MFSKELSAATARPLVLSILAEGESYGYEIIQRVKDLSDGEVEWAEGALYPVLHRLEKSGLIESYWAVADNGRRRKYYRIKPIGQRQLKAERRQWTLANTMLDTLWTPRLTYG